MTGEEVATPLGPMLAAVFARAGRWLGLGLLGISGALLTALVVLAAGLAIGPVSLGPLKGFVTGIVGSALGGARVGTDDITLVWDSAHGGLALRAENVRIYDLRGVPQVTAARIDLGLSAGALFVGAVRPYRVAIEGPQATVTRRADGRLSLGVAELTGEGTPAFDAAPIIAALLEAPGGDGALGGLSEIELSQATLGFRDEGTGTSLSAPGGRLALKRGADGLTGVIDVSLTLPSGRTRFYAEAFYTRGADGMTIEAAIDRIVPAELANAGVFFAPLAGLQLPLQGTMRLSFGLDGQMNGAELALKAGDGSFQLPGIINLPVKINAAELDGDYGRASAALQLNRLKVDAPNISGTITGALRFSDAPQGWTAQLTIEDGRIALPEFFDGSVDVSRLTLGAVFDATRDILSLERFVLRTGAATLTLDGLITGVASGKPGVQLQGAVSDLPLRQIGIILPRGVAEGVRQWMLDRVAEGVITSGVIRLDLRPEDWDAAALRDEAASFTFGFDGAEITYIRGLPPMTGVGGTAEVTGNRFSAKLNKGAIAALKFSDGDVLIADLAKRGEPAVIAGRITGPARSVLELIEREPLGYTKRYGISPEGAGGTAALDVRLSVPTLADLDVDDIGIDIKAKFDDLALKVDGGIEVSGGKVALAVTGSEMKLNGAAQISGIEAELSWHEIFRPRAGQAQTNLTFKGVLDDAWRVRLGLDAAPWLSGPSPVTLTLRGKGFALSDAAFDIDLSQAMLAVPELGFIKTPGVAAQVSGTVKRVEGGGFRIAPLTLSAGTMSGAFDLLISADRALTRVQATRFQLGRTDLSFTVDLGAERPLILIEGARLDLASLMKARSAIPTPSPPAEPAAASPAPSFRIEARIAELLLREGKTGAATLTLDVAKGVWQVFKLDGSIAGEALTGRLTGPAEGARQLTLSTGDFGSALNALTGFGSVDGGTAELALTLPPPAPDAEATGTLSVERFKLTDQPFLLRLFSAGSLTGIGDLLGGEGISFDLLKLDLKLSERGITADPLRLRGPALGVIARGSLDRAAGTISLQGTMAPLAGINTLLGDIPLIGDILGGEGGIVAVAFEIEGPIEEPSVSVNPLSVLAPGFLRGIFEFDSEPRERKPRRRGR